MHARRAGTDAGPVDAGGVDGERERPHVVFATCSTLPEPSAFVRMISRAEVSAQYT